MAITITNQQILTLGLDPEELTDIQLDYLEESLEVYNDLYQTEYTLENIPEYLIGFVMLNALMTIDGWKPEYRTRFSQDTIRLIAEVYGDEYQQYKGIEGTNRELLQDVDSVEDIDDDFIETRTAAVATALFGVFLLVQRELAKKDRRNYVGVITKLDDRVRPTHIPNHNRFWRIGTRPDFSKDFGCRCSYFYFATEQEARQAGFTRF